MTMGSRPFPSLFAPTTWRGLRAQEHTRREDAFQQLVGDGLMAVYGARAHVMPTAGRDGSIDAWIEQTATEPSHIFELPLPAIVECKDHDDALPHVARNVQQGWAKVAQKLVAKATAGWPSSFRPWKAARSYLYCVSCVLPNYQLRIELEGKIRRFFEKLAPENRPPIEKVRVVDWTDLRPWLDQQGTVSDQWLGVGLHLVLPLEEYTAGLSGFQKYLQQDVLPFVPPPQNSESHPEMILQLLDEAAGSGGVLLHGPGGIGKTRTALEVAHRAARDGWRVLYVLPGEPGVDIDMLAEVVLSGSGRTLILVDYLDQAHRLDLGTIRRTLIPQALKKGTPVALLATSRPGWLLVDHPERDALLKRRVAVDPPDDQRNAITDRIVNFAAPMAVAQLGRGELRRICGYRPILALLIAREVERQVREGSWRPAHVTGIRQGDLLYWLRRRLAEDRITVRQPASPLVPASPEPEVTAVAACLGCAPQPRSALVEAAQHALSTLEAGGVETAEHVVSALIHLGWIEMREGDYATAHDVVADDVLEQTLLGAGGVRRTVLAAVLSVACNSARSFGRLANSLQRLVTGIDVAHGTLLEEALGAWLSEHAGPVASALVTEDIDTASYAIGSALDGPPWSSSIIRSWDVLVSPWLSTHGHHTAARHLYYRGLRSVPIGAAEELVSAASRWLDTYPTLQEAQFVLAPLLARADLQAGEARQTITAGLRWLDTYPTLQEAGFVLARLLARADLQAGEARKAITASLGWLDEHAATEDAEFIFRYLFRRPEPSRPDRSKAAKLAIYRLRTVLDTEEATFLLRTLLGDRYLDADLNIQVVQLGLEWLDSHPGNPASDFVFNRILRIPHVDDGSWRRAAGHAFGWLEAKVRYDGADRVLFSLITRRHLLSDNELARIVDATLDCIGPPRFVNRLFLRLEEVVRGEPTHARVLEEMEARGLYPE